jgi:hypothetical protein
MSGSSRLTEVRRQLTQIDARPGGYGVQGPTRGPQASDAIEGHCRAAGRECPYIQQLHTAEEQKHMIDHALAWMR